MSKHTLKSITELYQETFYTTDTAPIALLSAILVGSRMNIPPVWLYLIGPSSGGKSLDGNTKVLCYDGTFKKAQDVQVGDLLMGDDSTPRTVKATHSGKETMYKIIQETGEDYVVNESHILSLKQTTQKKDWKDINKGEVVDIELLDYLKKSKHFKSSVKGFKVGVNFQSQSTTIDPYYLGLWLGDGHMSGPSVSKSDKEIENYISSYAKKLNLNFSKKPSSTSKICYEYAIVRRKGTQQSNPLWQEMKKIGITENKHVPYNYKVNSRKIRLQVLAGLLDTDGYLDERQRFQFSNKSKQLAEDVVFLARSLGLSANINQITKGIKRIGFIGKYWSVNITGQTHLIPTKIARRKATERRYSRDPLATGIKIKKLTRGTYYGFQLDGNGRFLLGDFTVTHNSAIIECFNKVPFCYQVSDLTPNTFLSGMSNNTRETSLLSKLGLNFTILMKDFTTIMQKSEETQGAIIAQMREIYDGHITKETGTGIPLSWGSKEAAKRGHATFIMAATEAIFAVQDKFADMGTRATNYVLLPQDRKLSTKRALRNNNKLEKQIDRLQTVFCEFVMDKVENKPAELSFIDEKLEDELIEVADFSTICRSVVKRDYRGVKSLALSAEMPMRISKQFLSQAQLLTHINDGELTDDLKNAVFKTGFDSIPKQRRLVLEALAKYPRVTVSGVADYINYPPDRAKEWIEDLNMFGVCYRIKAKDKQYWVLKDEHRETMKKFLHVKQENKVLEGENEVGDFNPSAGNYEDLDISFETQETKVVLESNAEIEFNKF